MTDRNSTIQSPSKQVKRKRITTDEFIKRSKARHGDKFTYEHTVYKNCRVKVKVTCRKHGVVEVRMDGHLENYGCPHCGLENNSCRLSREDFIAKCVAVHGSLYDYSLVEYTGNKNHVKIICADHGVFLQVPSLHMSGAGCADCSKNRKITTEVFIRRSKALHGGKYGYQLVEVVGYNKPVKILCSKHGIFKQSVGVHLNGSGCPKCSNYGALTSDDFYRACVRNNKGQGVLYVIECLSGEESFFKIGITSHSAKARFKSGMPYSYNTVYEVMESPSVIYDLEVKLHAFLENYRYKPVIKFKGYTECFTTIKPIERLLKRLSTTEQLQLLA